MRNSEKFLQSSHFRTTSIIQKTEPFKDSVHTYAFSHDFFVVLYKEECLKKEEEYLYV